MNTVGNELKRCVTVKVTLAGYPLALHNWHGPASVDPLDGERISMQATDAPVSRIGAAGGPHLLDEMRDLNFGARYFVLSSPLSVLACSRVCVRVFLCLGSFGPSPSLLFSLLFFLRLVRHAGVSAHVLRMLITICRALNWDLPVRTLNKRHCTKYLGLPICIEREVHLQLEKRNEGEHLGSVRQLE